LPNVAKRARSAAAALTSVAAATAISAAVQSAQAISNRAIHARARCPLEPFPAMRLKRSITCEGKFSPRICMCVVVLKAAAWRARAAV